MKRIIECPECSDPIIADIHPNNMGHIKGILPYTAFFNHEGCCNGASMSEGEVFIMKALSIRQPWAWLIAHGYKPLENRETLRNFRGTFLIHASKKFDHQGYDWIIRNGMHRRIKDFPKLGEFERGGIVGVGKIIDSITESSDPWFFGPNAFVIENPKPLPLIRCRGQLGFFIPKLDD